MQPSNLSVVSRPLPSVIQTSLVGECFASTGPIRLSSRTFVRSQRKTSPHFVQTDFLSLLQASPVKTLASQENRQDTMESEVCCFMKSSVWLGSFDLTSSCLKTLGIYYPTKTGKLSKKPSFKLPKQGTMQSGQLFQQVIWEPVTSENASGLLPTPRTCSAMAARINTEGNLGKSRFPNLETVIGRMLPTPTASDHLDRTYHYPACVGVTRGEKLSWTVGAELGHNYGNSGKPGENRSILTGDPMYLNPHFVEEMMGYPIGWTDLSN